MMSITLILIVIRIINLALNIIISIKKLLNKIW